MSYEKINLVEVGGIEPPSEYNVKPPSTCVVFLLFSPVKPPENKLSHEPAFAF